MNPRLSKENVAFTILFLSAITYFPYKLVSVKIFSEEIAIEVVQNDASAECSSSMTRIVGGKYRSDAPTLAGFGYCGIIISDHGGFKLPEPVLGWRLGVEDRASIDRRLMDGHCYEVRVYGFGQTPRLGDPLSNRGHWEIVSVVGETTCES